MGVAPSFAARLHDDITSGPARVYGASVVPTVASRLLCASVNPEFSDVQVVVGSETYRGHCVILSRVPFFAATLRHSFAAPPTARSFGMCSSLLTASKWRCSVRPPAIDL